LDRITWSWFPVKVIIPSESGSACPQAVNKKSGERREAATRGPEKNPFFFKGTSFRAGILFGL
jgi:hypothetical protein